jgi:hypothetical protein
MVSCSADTTGSIEEQQAIVADRQAGHRRRRVRRRLDLASLARVSGDTYVGYWEFAKMAEDYHFEVVPASGNVGEGFSPPA